MRIFNVYILLLPLLLGCQTTKEVKLEPGLIFHDGQYTGYQQVDIESPQQIFALNQAMQTFVEQKFNRSQSPRKNVETLIRSIFAHSELDLLYVNSANTIAIDTFQNRAANCLSLSILTYAMAEHAGLQVDFQEVKIPEYWTMRNGYSLRNGHINLVIYPKPDMHTKLVYGASGLEVDFDRSAGKKHLPKKIINKHKVLAMFYNNKGADALVNGDKIRAYAYFRRALIQDPSFGSAWVNLGLLYRMDGYLPLAEQSYQQALALNADDTSALENLAYVYSLSDRKQKAKDIRYALNRKRQSNPNYHFILGEQAYHKDQWQQAIDHYRTAIKLGRQTHEFYFAMAKAYYKLGDINLSQSYLKRAKKLASDDNIEQRYQSKLNMLTRI